MKLKNVLIVVKDIEKSKQFYHDLFGLNLVEGRHLITIAIMRNIQNAMKALFLGGSSILTPSLFPRSYLRSS